MGLLDGKKALVTGARKGIGRGIAVRLAAEGADVGVNDILDDEVTRQTAALAKERGSAASVHIADVSRLTEIDGMIDSFLKAEDRDLGQAAVETLQKVRSRSYSSLEEFGTDLLHCQEAASNRDNLKEGSPALDAWRSAGKRLESPYWKRFLFGEPTGD